jgi:hypothetical protein
MIDALDEESIKRSIEVCDYSVLFLFSSAFDQSKSRNAKFPRSIWELRVGNTFVLQVLKGCKPNERTLPWLCRLCLLAEWRD